MIESGGPSRKQRREEERERAKTKARRQCGPCTACCFSFAVTLDDGPKPACEVCKHLSARGCGIYHKRPTECRTFECMWRSGFFNEEMRPDLVNAIFAITYKHADGWWIFRLRPAYEGEQSPKVSQLVQRIMDDRHVVLVESLEELRNRRDLGDSAIVPIRYFAVPGHPVFQMETLPIMEKDRR
jgi:Fe-S-cluster containining protein